MEFRGQVVLGGKTATGIEVPASVVEALGSAKQPAVIVGVGGHSYRVAFRKDAATSQARAHALTAGCTSGRRRQAACAGVFAPSRSNTVGDVLSG